MTQDHTQVALCTPDTAHQLPSKEEKSHPCFMAQKDPQLPNLVSKPNL